MDLDLISQLGKKPEPLAITKSKAAPIKTFEGFFSQEELKFLLELKDRAYSVKESLRERQGPNSNRPSDLMAWPMGDVHDELEDFFQEKMKPYLEGPVKFGFAFHKNYHPYGLHTDAGYDPDEIIYRQGIIPLEINPSEAPTYTVIMKQKCYFSCSFPAKRQYQPAEREASDHIKKNWIENFRHGEFLSEEELEKYWLKTDFYREWLQGFEIDHAFRWRIGDMATWDRSQIHCSSDFERFDVEYKLGLMWVTSL